MEGQTKRQASEKDGRQKKRHAYGQEWRTKKKQGSEKDAKTNLAIFSSFRFALIVSIHLAYFPFDFASDSCFFASMRNKRKKKKFASKGNEIFASLSFFDSKPKTPVHPNPDPVPQHCL
jgi:hypothetical protein